METCYRCIQQGDGPNISILQILWKWPRNSVATFNTNRSQVLVLTPGNIATASSQQWPVVSCLVTAAAAVLTDSVWDQEMKVTRHSHCSQLSLSSSLMTLLLINIMLLTADSVLTVFNSPHPFFSIIHHLTLSILQVLIQKSIFMHWSLPPPQNRRWFQLLLYTQHTQYWQNLSRLCEKMKVKVWSDVSHSLSPDYKSNCK